MGKTQRWVAEQVGVSLRAVQGWVAGESITRPNLYSLARLLDTTPEWLADGSVPPSIDQQVADRLDDLDQRLRQAAVQRRAFVESAGRVNGLEERLSALEETVEALVRTVDQALQSQSELLEAQAGQLPPAAHGSNRGARRSSRSRAPGG